MSADLKQYNLTTLSAQADPFPVWRQMLQDGPIVRSKMLLVNRVWLATTWDAASQVFRNQELFARESTKGGKSRVPGMKWWMPKRFARLANNMMAFDGEKHRRLRGLVDQAFHRAAVDKWSDRIEQIANELIDEMIAKQRSGMAVEFVSQFCRQLPLSVICELLGLPKEDQPKFKQWFRAFAELKSAWGLFWLFPGVSKLLKYFDAKFLELKDSPQPGLLSELVQMELDGDRLTHDELVSTVFILLVAGHETTVHLLSTGLHSLILHPQALEEIREEPCLWTTAVEECLRYNSPVQMSKPRIVTRDNDFHGQELRKGEYIMAVIGSANADPSKFDAPERFDLRRDPNPHLSFGSGIHTCLGLKLAKAEAEIGLGTLLKRCPRLAMTACDDAYRWHGRLGMRCLKYMHLNLEES